MGFDLTTEQNAAVERRDSSLLVRAGAGTGKTSVLVERFVAAALEEDEPRVDAILAITFTEKAAAELRTRVRKAFLERGRRDLARDLESAWISTIHGFCARVLRTHALAAGLDPEFRVLDEVEAERVGIDAFDRALRDFIGEPPDSERIELLATYTPDKVQRMVRTAYAWLRSRGWLAELPEATPPAVAGEPEALAAAARAALKELDGVGGDQVRRAMEGMEACLAALERSSQTAGDYEPLRAGGNANALKTDAVCAYNDALARYVAWCTGMREYADHRLLRELLRLYDDCYSRLKTERSGVDFEDLELGARDLLSDEGLRARYRDRFSHVLVDEFQDTNPLQNEILGRLDDDNLFRVGDERQSIYGFRHADVGVFQGHAEKAEAEERLERLTLNFRSRPEVLDAIDLAFGRVWEDYEPLRAPGPAEAPPRLSPCIELLVTDRHKGRFDTALRDAELPFGPALREATPWRAAEARLLARRIEELTREGPYDYCDVALLLRATTHLGFYERALEERGIPTYVLGGRGYWSQQQVADLRAWLAALANPRDELALYSVLASPLAGVSLDGLALLGLRSRTTPHHLWRMLDEDGVAAELPDGDRERAERFVELFRDERETAPRVSLETLIDRAVTRTGYDRAVLAMPAGDRRLANVRKLMRMAREYESEEGRDLRGFIDFVAERDLIQEREGQAPLEAEQLDAIRVMTIHRAKGLEFPVVCVADLGKGGREDDDALRISDDGEVGLRLAEIGGGSIDSEKLKAIKERRKLEAEEEEKRILYVAVTRAQEHLVLSGATDLEKLDEEKPLEEPMRWVWRSFAPGLPELDAGGEAVDRYDGREVRVSCTVLRPADLEVMLPEADRQPARPDAEEGSPVPAQPELATVEVPDALPVSRLSYSALEGYNRCGYRFYLERVLGLRGEREPPPQPGGDELAPLLRGSIVHQLLEEVDFARPVAPAPEDIVARLEAHGAPAGEDVVADLTRMVEAFGASEIRRRLAEARRVRTELPFVYTLDGVLVNGVVDVHAQEDDRVLVVDYKSDPVEGLDLEEYCESRYATQRLVYALAALRSGAKRAEVAYVFLERPGEPVKAVFEAADADRLEAELAALAAGVLQGRFVPSDQPHRGLCWGCPGRAALCSHDDEMTMRELPEPV